MFRSVMPRAFVAALVAVAGVSTVVGIPGVAFAQDYSQIRAMTRPGAEIYGSSSTLLGTIESVDKRTFVLKTPDGPLTLSRGVISLGTKGLHVGKTPTQIRDMAANQAADRAQAAASPG